MNPAAPTLYLRADGSLMLAKGEATIELRLTAAQLLQLGLDCLQTAVQLDSSTLPKAVDVLDAVVVPRPLLADARRAVEAAQIAASDACPKH